MHLAGTHRIMGQWAVFISEFSESHILQPKLASDSGGVSGRPPCSWLESEWDAGLFGSPSFHSKVSVTFEISNVISHTVLTENIEEAAGWEEGSGGHFPVGAKPMSECSFPPYILGWTFLREGGTEWPSLRIFFLMDCDSKQQQKRWQFEQFYKLRLWKL